MKKLTINDFEVIEWNGLYCLGTKETFKNLIKKK